MVGGAVAGVVDKDVLVLVLVLVLALALVLDGVVPVVVVVS